MASGSEVCSSVAASGSPEPRRAGKPPGRRGRCPWPSAAYAAVGAVPPGPWSAGPGSGELSGRVRRQRPYGELRYVVTGIRILECDSRCVQGDNSRTSHRRTLHGYASMLRRRPPVGPHTGKWGAWVRRMEPPTVPTGQIAHKVDFRTHTQPLRFALTPFTYLEPHQVGSVCEHTVRPAGRRWARTGPVRYSLLIYLNCHSIQGL